MALTLTAKPATADYRYTWTPPLADGDSLASYTLAPVDCTILAEEMSGSDVLFLVSGGTAGTVAAIAAEAVTNDGETLVETLYLPITGVGNAFSTTARDVCLFALRPIAGMGNVPEAEEFDDALEKLNDMVASWAAQGAGMPIPLPIAGGDTLYAPDSSIKALKYNLRMMVVGEYGMQPSPVDAMMARTGLQQVKQAGVPEVRAAADYF